MVSDPVFEDGWWRGGLTVDERRAAPMAPVWANDTEQALAQVEDLPALAATFPSWRQGYAEVLRPFVEWAVRQVPPHPCVPAFAERLRTDLATSRMESRHTPGRSAPRYLSTKDSGRPRRSC